MGDEKNALVINVKIRRMKAATACATLGYAGLLPRSRSLDASDGKPAPANEST